MKNFKNIWRAFYEECAPISYSLKYDLQLKWLRFHSLPNSKRYADNKKEWLEILSRYNVLLKEIMSDTQSAFIIYASFNSEFEIRKHQKCIDEIFKSNNYYSIIYDEMPYKISFETIDLNYNFDNIFKLIADDELDNLFIMNPLNGDIFAPYDGGTDLIINDAHNREIMRNKYSNWLSEREDGC